MHLDVIDLRRFYYRTPLGRAAQRSLQEAIRALWPNVAGETVVGFGFAAPLLRPFVKEAARVVCLMPGPQGVCRWPPEGPNMAVLAEETHWPLRAGAADRLIVAHALENSERPSALLEEMRRVLAPEGRAIVVVPNRSGMWARSDATPFGYGRPYSTSQLESALRAHDLAPEHASAALYGPPSHRRYWLRTHRLWEAAGRRLDVQRLGGAVLVEATRRVYALPRSGLKEKALSPLEVLEGLAKPARPRPAAGRAPRRGPEGRGDGAAG
ncbi:Methyltransferase domain-containing protein [Albimonas donghaensis]|uniref:Methyltransferase domain-containing protein n=1 Tax=Albimonas donghaensis TaxID=356660 RepID=A0A1H2RCL6_9RHOB|nr:methyltransferase domain-containing protein [Albimonas donghaensis]MAS44093.1 methyltransferase domain-containing protein [Paracoccaceae bacterium]MBR26128.1 methyltransferase domain-containing protein [Paracoccaceae bacterium]SDW17172.1 Methyltransferase domain-containing protein [Albimonas donghaensis]